MIKGLYSAASAMLVGMDRQNVLSHNIANLETPGFKQTLLSMDEFLTAAAVQPVPTASLHSNMRLVGDLGLGVQIGTETTDFTQGALKFTGKPLDLSVHGNGFFRVETPNGERYTRDGRFNLDSEGYMVSVDGYFLLDADRERIQIDGATIGISTDGTLFIDGVAGQQIGLAAFEDPAAELTPDLANIFAAAGEPTGETPGEIQQGYLEMANANPSDLMTQMVIVSRAYEAAQRMVQAQDELLGAAIGTLGRI